MHSDDGRAGIQRQHRLDERGLVCSLARDGDNRGDLDHRVLVSLRKASFASSTFDVNAEDAQWRKPRKLALQRLGRDLLAPVPVYLQV